MKFKASPGIAIVCPIEEKRTIITNSQQGRIVLGEIVEMGPDDTNNYGSIVKAANYGKKGDQIYFLSYYQEGGYDQVTIDNIKYYLVKFGDFRINLT